MGKFSAAQTSGSADVKLQAALNYLCELLDSGYVTEALRSGNRIRIDVNPKDGLIMKVNDVSVFYVDNTGTAVFTGNVTVGGTGNIGKISVLNSSDVEIIRLDEDGIWVDGLVKAEGFINTGNWNASITTSTVDGVGHVRAFYGDYDLSIFHFWHQHWDRADGTVYGDFATDGFFRLRHLAYGETSILSQLTFGHDGYLGSPYIESSTVFRAPTPVGTTDVTNKAYVDGYFAYGNWTPTDTSGADLTFTYSQQATYSKCGRMVTAFYDITFPSTSDTNYARVSIPFAKASAYNGTIGFSNFGQAITHHEGYFYKVDGTPCRNSELSGKRIVATVVYTATS